MSLSQERSTAEQVFYTWVVRSRLDENKCGSSVQKASVLYSKSNFDTPTSRSRLSPSPRSFLPLGRRYAHPPLSEGWGTKGRGLGR